MRRIRLVALLLATSALVTHAAFFAVEKAVAAPVIGSLETFASGTGEWDGGGLESNPGTGGADGAADGYLHVQSGFQQHLGSRNDGLTYAGDWIAAGADRVRFSLSDVGEDQDLEIHFAIGLTNNLWQYNTGFLPPDGAWAEFEVDLSSASAFTRTIGLASATFPLALSGATRVLIRHDKAPYTQGPDMIVGEFGIDNVLITSSLVGVPGGPGTPVVGRPVWLAPPAPNPSRGAVACAIETYDDGPVQMSVVDVRGRIVRAESLAPAAAGRRTWMWDGRDSAGRAVAAGAYRIRAKGASGGTSRMIVRVD
ncbi:MAG: FlgD immunoglobulin-like domain containing protein [Candidatus Eiseniibacteriota bacterium]